MLNYGEDKYRGAFVYHMKKYAKSHHMINEKGEKVMWIDEVLHPLRQEGTSRNILIEQKAEPMDRGKDYNHSTFCDLVISGICGVNIKDGKLDVSPIVPDDWDYFKLSHLYICGKEYSIEYNKETGIKTTVTDICFG